MAAPKATAFTVSMAGDRGAPKPKPARRGPFKFLKKDEGMRVDHAAHPQDEQNTPRRSGPPVAREREFRKAIAADMQRGERDPFAEALVAVPKRPPPSKQPGSSSPRRESPPNGRKVDTAALDEADDDLDALGASDAPADTKQHREPPELAHTRRPKDHAPQLHDDEDEEALSDEDMHEQEPDPADYSATASAAASNKPRHQDPHGNGPAHADERRQERSEQPRTEATRPKSRLEILREATRKSPERDDNPYEYRPQRHERVHRRADLRPASQPAPARRRAQLHDDDDDAHGRGVDQDDYDNYFDRPPPATSGRSRASRAPAPRSGSAGGAEPDEELMAELERQLEEVRAEKLKYQRKVADFQRLMEREKSTYDHDLEELQNERDEFERWAAEEKRAIRAERRKLEEQRRKQSEHTGVERDATRRLKEELEMAREALDKMSVDMRDKDRAHRAETERLKREVADLQGRNDELTEMVRAMQADEAERNANQRATTTRDRAPASGSRGVAARGTRHRSPSVDDDVSDSPPPSEERARAAATRDVRSNTNARRADDNRRGMNVSAETRHAEPARDHDTGSARKPAAASPAKAPAAQRKGNFIIPTPEEFVADIVEPVPVEEVPGDSVTARNVGTDGRSEQLYRSGKRVINFANGTRKVILQSGHVILHFSNGDVKRTYPSGKTTYWYAVAQAEQTQMPDGLQLYQFLSSQQTEKHFPDGRKEILYPEGVYKVIDVDGRETTYFPDGSVTNGGP